MNWGAPPLSKLHDKIGLRVLSSATPAKPGVSSPVHRNQLRRACARFATGVSVLTTRTLDGRPHGLTVNSFTSVSIDPPLILVCLDARSSALPHIRECRYFCVNLLGEDQQNISELFAGKRDDRFAGVDWNPGISGAPVINGGIGHPGCEVAEIRPAGDHSIVLGSVLHTYCGSGRPLLYFGSGYARLSGDEV